MAAPESAMTRATWAGDVALVSRIVALDPSQVNSRDAYQRSPLIMAATRGYLELAQLLVSKGAEVNAGDSRGYSALDWACTLGHADLAAFLLQAGADASLQGSYGETPLISAASNGHLQIVRLLLRHGGQCVDEKDKLGWTALASACECGHHQVARVLLLEGGASHLLLNRHRRTPKQVAQARGHTHCVALLEWFEGEVYRPFLLHKARTLHDDHSMHALLPLHPHPRPPYYSTRRFDPPVLTLQPPPSHDDHNTHKAPPLYQAEHKAAPSEEEEGEVGPMLAFVLHHLSPDLFTELMQGLQLRGSCVEEEGTHEGGKMERYCPKVTRAPFCCVLL